jgi:RimJ/RimL family protein N-acetyltransferase
MASSPLRDIWPVLELRIRTPRLELRPIDTELGAELAELAAQGIHDPASMPFLRPWTDVEPPELQRNTLRHYWQTWSTFAPDAWTLPFAVFDDGQLVGSQSVFTVDYPVVRSFETGSWLGRRFQGRGIGKEMRAAVVQFMFDGLDARVATTGAYADNAPSLGVTRALGYEDNGRLTRLRRGEAADELLFRMPRAAWEPRRRDDITFEGVDEACLAFLGLSPG